MKRSIVLNGVLFFLCAAGISYAQAKSAQGCASTRFLKIAWGAARNHHYSSEQYYV
jgi:hypothetical protein